MLKSVLLGLFVALLVILADQYTKWMAVSFMFPDLYNIPDFQTWLFNASTIYQTAIIEINSYLNIVMVWNFGVSFGILNTGSDTYATMLIVVSLVICFFLLIWLWRTYALFTTLLLGMIIGGAMGNVIDRVRFGAVIDFIDIHVSGYHWPAFNIADAAITTSVIFLILIQLFGNKNEDTY